MLLDAGADIEIRNNWDWRPLMIAAWKSQPRTVALLLDRGAEINARDIGGRSALMKAATRGSVESVKVLLARGADPSFRDKKGRSAENLTKDPEIKRLLTGLAPVATAPGSASR
jgi:ankyrin repeat protein